MAQPQISDAKKKQLRDYYRDCGNLSKTARHCKVSHTTARRWVIDEPGDGPGHADPAPAPQANGLPAAKHEQIADMLGMPAPHPESYEPFKIDTPGRWLILSDIHAPYHDRTTLELAVTEAKRRGVVGVLLNGDTLDSHEISNHDKDPSAPRYIDEIDTARKLLAWLRAQLPGARLVLKEGNHEERLERYVIQRAPALFGLEGIDLPSLLHFRDVGAEWVSGRRVIALGKLCVVHGHEYRGGGGVNPARWLYLRARYVSICGHFHRSSEHGERNIRGTEERAWSLGCACYLFPRYMPLNSWNHGCAFVEVSGDGNFAVENKRVFGGKLV
jgi:predicted phosphodiesterase